MTSAKTPAAGFTASPTSCSAQLAIDDAARTGSGTSSPVSQARRDSSGRAGPGMTASPATLGPARTVAGTQGGGPAPPPRPGDVVGVAAGVHRAGQVHRPMDREVVRHEVEHLGPGALGVAECGVPDPVVQLDAEPRHEGP